MCQWHEKVYSIVPVIVGVATHSAGLRPKAGRRRLGCSIIFFDSALRKLYSIQ